MWEQLSKREQFDILNTRLWYDVRNSIINDIIQIPSKIQFIKGDNNKSLVMVHIPFFNGDLKLLSEFYKTYPNLNYCSPIIRRLNNLEYSYMYTDGCSKELFDHIIDNIADIFTHIHMNKIPRFFDLFKKFISKETIITINNNLPKNFKYNEILYHCVECLYGEQFKNQLKFINTLGDKE